MRFAREYLQILKEIRDSGRATEHSYRPALKTLLEEWAESHDELVRVTNEPSRDEHGAPDFIVTTSDDTEIVGYLETKDLGAGHLDEVAESEQLKRYREAIPNLILTDYLEFILHCDGKAVKSACLARPAVLDGKLSVSRRDLDEMDQLLEMFFSHRTPAIQDAESLARELARRTRLLASLTHEVLQQEIEKASGRIFGFYTSFREYLLRDLDPHRFADYYAQTIAYGLFIARLNVDEPEKLTRFSAWMFIPKTAPLLRELFSFLASRDLPSELEWLVNDLVILLRKADMGSILPGFTAGSLQKDPVVHFYETFLATYDPAERERRGVYYTPEPVVSYIIRSGHQILKKTFRKRRGLATRSVILLDPAAGTGTFVAAAIHRAHQAMEEEGAGGLWPDLVRDHILKNFYAFELLMPPYAIAHLKLPLVLRELGYRLAARDDLKIYLTNTLEAEEIEESHLPFVGILSVESKAAGTVKRETPVLVIIGNPPYSYSSTNNAPWIRAMIEDYKQVDGKPLGEAKSGLLQDDYIKFIRFAEWKIAESGGEGVVGYITNNSYLSGLIHRGMRQHLLNNFTDIYVLNLHGNSLIKETCPDGSKDENVFDIQVGTAIVLFVKEKNKSGCPKIHYADLWGLRDAKYKWLNEHDTDSIKWETLGPTAPWYFLEKKDLSGAEDYLKWPSVKQLFQVSGQGVITSRDHFVVDTDKDELIQRIEQFADPRLSDEQAAAQFKLRDTREFSVAAARKKLLAQGINPDAIRPYAYRPFDVRWIYYDDALIEWPRPPLSRTPNLFIATLRRIREGDHQHFYIASELMDKTIISSKDNADAFPLYHYESFMGDEEKRVPNFHPDLLPILGKAYGKVPDSEEVFFYVYGIFHSLSYREQFQEHLKIGYPRVPFTKDPELFHDIARLGREIGELHLLKSERLKKIHASYPESGDHTVERFQYDQTSERLYINKSQYFGDVPPEVWEYRIGGYQVLSKYLKDRRNRNLTADEVEHLRKVITAIKEVLTILPELDELYLKMGAEVIEDWPEELVKVY